MKFEIRGKTYEIKPYVCSPNTKFPFYINITNRCNARCEFCCNGTNKDYRKLDLDYLKEVLDIVSDKVSRISISGGETMIDSEDLENLMKLVNTYGIRTTINSNGSFLKKNVQMLNQFENLEAVILSRHHYEDIQNNGIFKIDTLGWDEINNLGLRSDLRINCLLIKGFIDSLDEVTKYLDIIGEETKIFQVGFISMMGVNEYTKNNFVDYRDLTKDLGEQFQPVELMQDGCRCSCANYFYTSKCGRRIFVYFRYTKEYGCSGRSLFFDCAGLKEGY
ncbi:MAG: radical SAM protein [Bacilli bacterium]|nr:radical SAM protein [Bacilli bacterium]